MAHRHARLVSPHHDVLDAADRTKRRKNSFVPANARHQSIRGGIDRLARNVLIPGTIVREGPTAAQAAEDAQLHGIDRDRRQIGDARSARCRREIVGASEAAVL